MNRETLREKTLRARLEMQGYDLDTASLRDVGPWLRWAPALCAVGAAAAAATQSAALVGALAVVALAGAALPRHPFDHLYNLVVRHITGTGPLPAHAAPRRFACGLASVWLAGTASAFAAGATALAGALAFNFVALASVVAITNVCLPSVVYHAVVGHPRSRLAPDYFAS